MLQWAVVNWAYAVPAVFALCLAALAARMLGLL
jgi:hypothetical protein